MNTDMISHKNKSEVANDKDGLSSLPVDIISHILSCLPTADAVRTCVLSREWKHKWNFIYNIDTDSRHVDKILSSTHNSNSTLKSFRLSCYQEHDPYDLPGWISAALSRQVQNLVILLPDRFMALERTVLPQSLLTCTSLTELDLTLRCTLTVSVKNCFSNLKKLHLYGTEILNDQKSPEAGKLLLSFPVLESLDLEFIRLSNVTSLEIWAPELIRFSVSLLRCNNCKINIFGPKLAEFRSLFGPLCNFVLNAPSARHMTLDQYLKFGSENLGSRAYALLKGVAGLKCLALSGSIVHALVDCGVGILPLPKFYQLKELELKSCCRADYLLDVLDLMPNVESLSMYALSFLGDDMDLKPLPSCIVSHLKEVKFHWLYGHGVATVKFFVKNAKKLQRVSMVVPSSKSVEVEVEIRHELSAFIPNDSNCKTEFDLICE